MNDIDILRIWRDCRRIAKLLNLQLTFSAEELRVRKDCALLFTTGTALEMLAFLKGARYTNTTTNEMDH